MAIHTTASSFNSAFSKLIKASEKKVEEVVKDVAVDLVVNLTLRSPVDTGRFRKNWNVAINEINYQTDFEVQNNAVQRSVKVVEKYRLGDTINITNSLPYAARLEYESWSKQAPDGMVRLTLIDYPKIMRRRAQKVAK